MFDEHQRSGTNLKANLPLIVVACGGGAMLLSFGLCGVAASVYRYRVPFIAQSGFVLFGISIVLILSGVLWLLVIAIINAFRS
ncbi:MAG TPA: hypothetical protein VGM11_10090 [Acidobacteriaceae bacterium]